MLGWSRAGCGAGLSQWSLKILPAPSFRSCRRRRASLHNVVDVVGHVAGYRGYVVVRAATRVIVDQ